MRYSFALLVCVASVVVASASCGSGKGASSGSNASGTGGHGGATATGGAGGSNGSQGGASSMGSLSGTFATSTGTGGSTPCSTYKGTCAKQGLDCGNAPDGCGNMLDCGPATCPMAGQICGAFTPNVCGTCTPKTCAGAGFDCGMSTDGCNGVLDCGACDAGSCGAAKPNVCGTGVCTPQTCAQQGFDCGMQGDTCGGVLDCGPTTCAMAGQLCTQGVCTTPVCTPKTCMDQGFNCGMNTDGCGNTISCGTCAAGEICGLGGTNVCGANPCTGLCTQQTTCTGTATTTITGTVYAPNGTDPLYNVLVYVPNGAAGTPTWGVQPFPAGVSCGACGAEVTGSPLISTTTAVNGTFTLTNVPVGANIPLVMQNGRWRRKITIPSVASCVTTTLAATQTSMPATEAQGDPADNIPLMGFVTGSVDALECVLLKIGIAQSEFSNPAMQGGTGRVRFYGGEGSAGATISATTPSATQLWSGTTPDIDQYDMVYFACQGAPYAKTAAEQSVVVNYANAGGRIFGTHYSYVWFINPTPAGAACSAAAPCAAPQSCVAGKCTNPFFGTADWAPEGTQPTPDPQTGYINQTFPQGLALAQWLELLYPTATLGQISINTLRHDFTNVIAPSSLWISLGAAAIPPGTAPMHYTFDTPVGVAAANQCGRALFDDFHVYNAATGGTTFPKECPAGAMTQQEKMLEFMIFDLGSCVAPPVCTPKTCAQAGAACGPAGDGCGNILQCGTCPANQVCVGGTCEGCTPKTCASQSFTCGMQGDGCGNILNCGACPSGKSCEQGACTTGTCTPSTCAAQNPPALCGVINDGCGNIINCGTCAAGQICGGGMVANQCFTPVCMPKNCAMQSFTCGSATDGCGNTINCGTCSGAATCGGCGTPNVCCGAG
jgi:hypothetical protein